MRVDVPPKIRERTVSKARTLLEALPFMQEHWGKTIVVKHGGGAMERAPLSRTFGNDLALLQHVGIHPLIVHGGGPQVTEVSARLGLPTTFVGGLRVTDEPTLDVATMVLAGRVNTEVVRNLLACGSKPSDSRASTEAWWLPAGGNHPSSGSSERWSG